ncbi:MAG TPA: hypothetical protein VK629_11460 [Steroidobacteraceae bacterium]|nr:hypothetical protein [Steroidobacteraceae bacterium]
MSKERLSFEELEALCERESCRFNDLFLIGENVFVDEGSDDWALPSKYRPLLLVNAVMMKALPEMLRRLDAIEFPSMQAFCDALSYRAEHDRVYPGIRDELYEVLTQHSRDGVPPDSGQYYLELDGCGEKEGLLVACEKRVDLTPSLVVDIQYVLQKFESTLNWNVRVHEGENVSPFCIVHKKHVESLG